MNRQEILRDWQKFLLAESYVLKDNPRLLFQQAANEPDSAAPAGAARARWEAGRETHPWIRHVNKPQSLSACRMTLAGHASTVKHCAWSRDGKRIVSSSHDDTLRIWDAGTGEEVARLQGHKKGIHDFGLLPDGERLISAGGDNKLRTWDMATGRELAETAAPDVCGMSVDGLRVARLDFLSRTVTVWETGSNRRIATLGGRFGLLTGAAFSPDGDRVVIFSEEGVLRIFDVPTGIQLMTLPGHAGRVETCRFSADGWFIASGGWDNTARVWHSWSAKQVALLEGHTEPVTCCDFSADGKRLATASMDCTARIWDLETGQAMAVFAGHEHSVECCALSPDDTRLVTGSADMTLRIWDAGATDLRTPAPVGVVTACHFSPDGLVAASVSVGGFVTLWDGFTGIPLARWRGHERLVGACGFSPDGQRLASGSEDGTLAVWDVKSGRELVRLPGHAKKVSACFFTPDSLRIISGSWDGTVRMSDPGAAISGASVNITDYFVKSVVLSPDGRYICAAASNGPLTLLDAADLTVLATFGERLISTDCCAFSPDSRQVIAGSWKTLTLWDVAGRRVVATMKEHTESVVACSFSPDGRFILSGSEDWTARLWDAVAGSSLRSFGPLTHRVNSCSFSPDGTRVMTLCDDGTLAVWDVMSGEQVCAYSRGGFRTAEWGPDGSRIAAGTGSGGVQLLRIEGI